MIIAIAALSLIIVVISGVLTCVVAWGASRKIEELERRESDVRIRESNVEWAEKLLREQEAHLDKREQSTEAKYVEVVRKGEGETL